MIFFLHRFVSTTTNSIGPRISMLSSQAWSGLSRCLRHLNLLNRRSFQRQVWQRIWFIHCSINMGKRMGDTVGDMCCLEGQEYRQLQELSIFFHILDFLSPCMQVHVHAHIFLKFHLWQQRGKEMAATAHWSSSLQLEDNSLVVREN